MDFWTLVGGLTMGAAAAVIYDMSSGPKMLGDASLQKGEQMFNGPFLGGVRIRGLGQAQMQAGQGFQGPFGIFSDVGQPGRSPVPSGFPTTTQKEMQTYTCPDGSQQSLTAAEAQAKGCRISPSTGLYVKGAPASLMGKRSILEAGRFLGEVSIKGMGQASGPSSPGTTSAPAGSATGNAIAAAGQPTFVQPAFLFPPPTPEYYPLPPTPQGMTCKRNVNPDTGEETFDCVPKPAPTAAFRYPVTFMNPLFY